MNEYNYDLTQQKIYYKQLENGLKIYLIPNSNQNHYYVNVACFYGSNDVEFTPINSQEMIKTPLGVAHFLEHKLFEMEDESNPFDFFGKTGTVVNASTGYYCTRYYIWGIKNIKENIKYFLDMIYKPYFTERNISKERGIIQEEINMYDDDPYWNLDHALRNNIFHNLYIKEKIGGSIESINEINDKTLYQIYNTFYQPNNMAIIIGGKFDSNDIMNFLENETILKTLPTGKEITRKEITEPETVKDEYKKIMGNIIIPKLKYAFKINKDRFSIKDPIILNMYLNCIFSSLFGSMGDFGERAYSEKLTTGYFFNHSYHDNYYVFEIEAESDKADLFKDLVDETINNINVSERDLNLHKKMWISSEVRLTDYIDLLVDSVIEDIITYNHLYLNRSSIIKKLNYSELKQVIKELDLSNNTFVLLLPHDN